MEWCESYRNAQVALAGRYACLHGVMAATVSKRALDVTFWKKMSDTLQMGSSLVLNPDHQKNVAALFYQWEAQDVVIRGMTDSNCAVGFTYTK